MEGTQQLKQAINKTRFAKTINQSIDHLFQTNPLQFQ